MDVLWGALLLVLLACSLAEGQRVTPYTQALSALRTALFSGYDNNVPPTDRFEYDAFSVRVVEPVRIALPEATLSLFVKIEETWSDARLVWDPASYAGIATVPLVIQSAVLQDDTWAPSFSIERLTQEESLAVSAYVLFANGTVFRTHIGVVPLFCDFSPGVSTFPYDEHTCEFIVTPQYPLLFTKDGTQSMGFADASNNELEDFRITAVSSFDTVQADISREAFLKARVTLERGASQFVQFILVPMVIVTGIAFLGFLLADAYGDRLALSISALLTIIALNYVSKDDIPKTTKPVMQDTLILISVCFCTFTAIEATLANWLYRTDARMPTRLGAVKGQDDQASRLMLGQAGCEREFYANAAQALASAHNNFDYLCKTTDQLDATLGHLGRNRRLALRLDMLCLATTPVAYAIAVGVVWGVGAA
mmetsp:Transcript_7449/g.18804  ORF Transcript_7449/g.18804 Transcript_7449/m.18804 type:complete len:424 (-) Transcript_7449:285-1556(-)